MHACNVKRVHLISKHNMDHADRASSKRITLSPCTHCRQAAKPGSKIWHAMFQLPSYDPCAPTLVDRRRTQTNDSTLVTLNLAPPIHVAVLYRHTLSLGRQL